MTLNSMAQEDQLHENSFEGMLNQRKIRVLHTIRQGEIGGGETHVLDLVQQLDPDVYDSTVLCFTEGEMVQRLQEIGIDCKVIYTEKPFDPRVFKGVKRFMNEGDFDLIHAHGTRACSNSLIAAKSLEIPIIYTVHGWSFHSNQSKLVRSLRQWIEKILVKNVTHTILVSKSNQQDGIQKLNMTRSQVVYNGVNLERFNELKKTSLTKVDLDLPEDKAIVGFVARLTIQKDPFTFIRAAKLVLDKGVNAHFLIVGDGELMTESKELVKNLELEAHITFSGFRSDVPEILNLLDVYCLPSLWEGLPIGILEAMAMKTAVVATAVDGTVELVKNGKTGLLCSPKKPEEFADAIMRLVNNDSIRKQLAQSAYKLVESDFTIKGMTEKVEALYSAVFLNYSSLKSASGAGSYK